MVGQLHTANYSSHLAEKCELSIIATSQHQSSDQLPLALAPKESGTIHLTLALWEQQGASESNLMLPISQQLRLILLIHIHMCDSNM